MNRHVARLNLNTQQKAFGADSNASELTGDSQLHEYSGIETEFSCHMRLPSHSQNYNEDSRRCDTMTNEFSGTVPRILNYIPLSSHDEHIHLSQVQHYGPASKPVNQTHEVVNTPDN